MLPGQPGKESGSRVEFIMGGRIQLNGDGGIVTYLGGKVLVNPHLSLRYKFNDADGVSQDRVSTDIPEIPEATLPHSHTFVKLSLIRHFLVKPL